MFLIVITVYRNVGKTFDSRSNFSTLHLYLVGQVGRNVKRRNVLVTVSGGRQFNTLTGLLCLLHLNGQPTMTVLTGNKDDVRRQRNERTGLLFRLDKGLVPRADVTTILRGALRMVKDLLSQCYRHNYHARQGAIGRLANVLHSSFFAFRSLFFALRFGGLVNCFQPSSSVPSVLPSRLSVVALTLSVSVRV